MSYHERLFLQDIEDVLLVHDLRIFLFFSEYESFRQHLCCHFLKPICNLASILTDEGDEGHR